MKTIMRPSSTAIYRDLFTYLQRPRELQTLNQTSEIKAKTLVAILILDLLLCLVLVSLMGLLEKAGLFSLENHSVSNMLKDGNSFSIFFLVVLVVPFFEEIIFRLYLRYRRNYLLQILFSLWFVGRRRAEAVFQLKFRTLWRKHFGIVFYFSAILFGFVHVYNFDLSAVSIWWFPIITAPQIVLGIFAAYLRVRFGLIMAVALHALHNAVLTFPVFFIDVI